MERIIPYMMENKSHVWNHQPANTFNFDRFWSILGHSLLYHVIPLGAQNWDAIQSSDQSLQGQF